MTDIVDFGEFAGRWHRAASRWDALREFHDAWGYTVRPDAERWDRWSESGHKAYVRALMHGPEADEFEGVDLTLPIPAALDEWWELPFNSFAFDARIYETNPEYPPTVRPDPSGYGVANAVPEDSDLIPPGADRRVCVFMAENQYCNEWGYPAAEAHEPDPRVLVSLDEDEWALQARSISEFFLQLAVQRLPHELGRSVHFYDHDVDDMEALLTRVRAELPAFGFEPWYELQQDAIVHGGPDVLVYDMHGDMEGVTVVGRTARAVVDFAGRFGLDLDGVDLTEPGR
ncbi:hypothetical protein [Actinomadura gamaensis]|uniref:Uncharacterized protein n=1 Tax=Actinomadura gamaensis TaxID=1763541 RepID=A0ABV9TZS3_9ACTN